MIEERIARLEHQQRWLKRYAFFVSALLVVMSGAAFLPRNEKVLRARGLVIVDDAGRERVLIGAPRLDGNNGTESVVLSVHDDGPSGLAVLGGKPSLFAGKAPPKSFVGNTDTLLGLVLHDGEKIAQQLALQPAK